MTTEKKIIHDGAEWIVGTKGVERDGKTMVHLWSTTEFRIQKNGKVPRQICDWVATELVA